MRKEKLRLKTFSGDREQIEKEYNKWADTLPDNIIIVSEIPEPLYPNTTERDYQRERILWVFYEIGADDKQESKISYG